MFLKTVTVIFILILSVASVVPAPTNAANDEFVVLKSNDFESILRHLSKRDVTVAKETGANEFVDKDYDMELAEVNVFRPVFRFRASYARRGG